MEQEIEFHHLSKLIELVPEIVDLKCHKRIFPTSVSIHLRLEMTTSSFQIIETIRFETLEVFLFLVVDMHLKLTIVTAPTIRVVKSKL